MKKIIGLEDLLKAAISSFSVFYSPPYFLSSAQSICLFIDDHIQHATHLTSLNKQN